MFPFGWIKAKKAAKNIDIFGNKSVSIFEQLIKINKIRTRDELLNSVFKYLDLVATRAGENAGYCWINHRDCGLDSCYALIGIPKAKTLVTIELYTNGKYDTSSSKETYYMHLSCDCVKDDIHIKVSGSERDKFYEYYNKLFDSVFG